MGDQKMMKLGKKVLGFTLTLSMLTTMVLAAATYPYGDYAYGTKNIPLKGDLSYSGLMGVQTRPSIAYRHDLRAQNVITGVQTPASGYLQTVQFDIQPLPGVEPEDKFKDKSGYHLVPIEEEIIKDLATKANGNAQWVWEQISNSSHPITKKYMVEKVPYVNMGAIFYLSGGGAPDMRRAEGDGITGPLFRTTYSTTPWPSIPILEQTADGSLHIKALAHSIYDTSIKGTVTVNGTASKQLFTKNTGVTNYTVTYESNVPLSDLPGIIAGQNTVTLTVTDAFGRTATKTITTQTLPTTGCAKPVLYHESSMEISQYSDQVVSQLKKRGEQLRVGNMFDWSMEFFPDKCYLAEGINNLPSGKSAGKVYSETVNGDPHFTIIMEKWFLWLSDTAKGTLLESASQSVKPLYLNVVDKRTNQIIKQYTLQKGQKIEIPYKVHLMSSPYRLDVLTPLDQRGFWNNQERYGSLWKTYNYPPELKSAINELLKAAQKK
jgi:hypothetical protein